jgi:hypothetical protein
MKKILLVLAIVVIASAQGKAQVNLVCSCQTIPASFPESNYKVNLAKKVNCYSSNFVNINITIKNILFTETNLNYNTCYPSGYNYVLQNGTLLNWGLIEPVVPPTGSMTNNTLDLAAQSVANSIKQHINMNFGVNKKIKCVELIQTGTSGFPNYPSACPGVKFIGFKVTFGDTKAYGPVESHPVDSVPKDRDN